MGDKKIREWVAELKEKKLLEEKVRISLVGHSLGGLISRYAVYELHMAEFFKDIVPWGFYTLASPHLGVRHPGKQVDKGVGKKLWSGTFHFVTSAFFGKTGAQLLLEDKAAKEKSLDKLKESLLFEMTTEPFLEPLLAFRFPTLVAITHFDILVAYCSAAIKTHNPYPVPS